MMFNEFLKIGAEVQQALAEGKPVVALESTIISHGMPYPENLTTAKEVEALIRKEGAVPATIAIYKGQIHIGIDDVIMDHLANSDQVIKASKRDIAYALSKGLSASTTVAATMFCAHLIKLPVFATGGIGGVHPHVSDSLDISADLIELSTTPVTVVCSGAKSILDLPKTLELLETCGVAVIGYKTDQFPAFYSHSSGIPLSHRLESADEIARLIHCQDKLKIRSGIVIANPIPLNAEIPDNLMAPIIAQAQKEAAHINGKAITPFLLKRITELSAGQSLHANIELIKSNAILGAQIAVALKHHTVNRTK